MEKEKELYNDTLQIAVPCNRIKWSKRSDKYNYTLKIIIHSLVIEYSGERERYVQLHVHLTKYILSCNIIE